MDRKRNNSSHVPWLGLTDDVHCGFSLDQPDELWLSRVRSAFRHKFVRDATTQSVNEKDHLGERIGPYKLVERIGTGGMGTVWRAHRVDDSFDQTVAIKLIKRGMDTDEIVRRFHLERQLMARLEHPAIARLYDGGATSDGQPYLVMEYIDGVPIDEYCKSNSLDVDQILDLLRSVCAAVHFAHSNLVLHRDIKPSNVLVTRSGNIKLLDFGIAKLLDDDQFSLTLTKDHAVLTPRYASPEQILGSNLTTASDVYSLGVLVYEVLTGRSPYEPLTTSREELKRAVVHLVPNKASSSIESSINHSWGDKREFRRRLRGDLDAILSRALQKVPHERYTSAEQLAEDIRRTQQGLPLLARPAGPIRRALRAVQRKRKALIAFSAVGAVAVAITAIVLGNHFMAPRWARDEIRNAQLSFLTPKFFNGVWVLTFNNAKGSLSRNRQPRCETKTVSRALSHYDAALRFDSGLDAVRIERDTIRLASQISQKSDAPPEPSQDLQRHAPLTCDYAVEWYHTKTIPILADENLDRAETSDLRSLGLLALLCGNNRDCLRSWSRLQELESDPLVESLLGLLNLALDEPQLAYPRLLSAYRRFPELGFLCIYLADAAIRCGDLSFGGMLIARAKTLNHQDPLGALERVELQYFLATGQEEQADRLFEESGLNRNPMACVSYAKYYFERGHRRRSLAILARWCGSSPNYRLVPAQAMRAVLSFTQEWWTELSESQRASALVDALEESCDDPESLFRILHLYATCVERVKRFQVDDHAGVGVVPLAEDSLLQSTAHFELMSLHDRLEVKNTFRWGRINQYPPELKQAQLEAWQSAPNPHRISKVVDKQFDQWRLENSSSNETWTKLLPNDDEVAFHGDVDIDGNLAVARSKSGLVILRQLDRRWERESFNKAIDWDIEDFAIDGEIILASLRNQGKEDSKSIGALMQYDPDTALWRVSDILPLPSECRDPVHVELSGDSAMVSTKPNHQNVGQVYLFHNEAEEESWRFEQVIEYQVAKPTPVAPTPSLYANTLAVISYDEDKNSGVPGTSKFLIFRRNFSGEWIPEAEFEPPPDPQSPEFTLDWISLSCSGDRVVAVGRHGTNYPPPLKVFCRVPTGEWLEEADLGSLVHDVVPQRFSRALGINDDLIAAGVSDPYTATTRGFCIFNNEETGWAFAEYIETPDFGFSDCLDRPAISKGRMVFNALFHDAAGIDAGALYIVDLSNYRLLSDSPNVIQD